VSFSKQWEWSGSYMPEEKSGTAVFYVGGQSITQRFDCYADAAAIARLLDVARDVGAKAALSRIKRKVEIAIGEEGVA